MLQGTDHLFGLWLSMFREHLSTLVSMLVLLPMTLFFNWRLALVLMILLLVSALLTGYVTRRTLTAQGRWRRVAATWRNGREMPSATWCWCKALCDCRRSCA